MLEVIILPISFIVLLIYTVCKLYKKQNQNYTHRLIIDDEENNNYSDDNINNDEEDINYKYDNINNKNIDNNIKENNYII